MVTNSKTIAEALGASGVTVAVVAGTLAVLWIAGIVWAVKQERLSRERWPGREEQDLVPCLSRRRGTPRVPVRRKVECLHRLI